MASVQERIETQTTTTKFVRLELNEVEAKALADILGRVGGSLENSRRSLTDGIYEGLRSVGYAAGYYEDGRWRTTKDLEGCLFFKDES